MRHLAFVTYETPFTPCGGIAAVLGRLPAAVARLSGLPSFVISPYHHKLAGLQGLDLEWKGWLEVPLDGQMVGVNLLQHVSPKFGIPFVFLQPSQSGIFSGGRHPYDLPSQDLLRDALFFGAAVARSLQVLAAWAPWTLFLQDWEAAPAGLALASMGIPHRIHMILHNSYDAWPSSADLERVGIDPERLPGLSMLERTHGITEKPFWAVSKQFAKELTEDPLQSDVVAPHLRWFFQGYPVFGVDNGPFMGSELAKQILALFESEGSSALLEWKAARRRAALEALDGFEPSAERPLWGDRSRFLWDEAPCFVMAGRDDPGQKGYDVAALAVRRFLEAGGEARFIFFPLPGDEGLGGLRFLADLAWDHPDSVLVLPFRWQEGYMATVSGANFGLMPSLYEPFGAANEIVLSGSVCLARATGGLIQQIVPYRDIPSFNAPVEWRSARYHRSEDASTGLLYREYDGIVTGIADWKGIRNQPYRTHGWQPDRIASRLSFDTYRGMASALSQAFTDAVWIYRSQPERYAEMIIAGIRHIQSGFSWERAAQEYLHGAGLESSVAPMEL